MKRWLNTFAILLALTLPAYPQSSVSGSLSASSTDCKATNACLVMALQTGVSAAAVTLSGTLTGTTVQFEASGNDRTSWVAISGTPPNSTTGVTSVTATAGTWKFSVGALTHLRVRCSTYSSGPVVVSLKSSTGSASLGGGGGAPSGAAGGDLSGTYPDPTVAQVNGAVVPTSADFLGSNASKQLAANPRLNDDGTTLTYTGTGGIASSGAAAGIYQCYEAAANGNNFRAFTVDDSLTGDVTWKLPAADASGCLQSDGAGNLSFAACGAMAIGGAISGSTPSSLLYVDASGNLGQVPGSAVSPGGAVYLSSTPLATPTLTVTPTCAGTCATAWGYTVVGMVGNLLSDSPAEVQTAAQAATLDGTHLNTIAFPGCSAAGYDHYLVNRITVGTSPTTKGYLNAGVPTLCGTAFVDDGVAGDGSPIIDRNSTGGLGVVDSLTVKNITSGLGYLQLTTASQLASVTIRDNGSMDISGKLMDISFNSNGDFALAGLTNDLFMPADGSITLAGGVAPGNSLLRFQTDGTIDLQNDNGGAVGAIHITPAGVISHIGPTTTNDRLTVQSNAAFIQPVTFTGAGLNDATSGGTFTGLNDVAYCVQIDANGTPDTFEWGTGGSCSNGATGVGITMAAQTLSNGVTITFAADIGHTIGDNWTFTAYAPTPLTLEDHTGAVVWKVKESGIVNTGGTDGATASGTTCTINAIVGGIVTGASCI